MAQNYKLVYFNVRGLGEPARYIFAYTGVDYEDVRIPMDKWADMKKDTPFGLLPYLEVDGKRLSQSSVICRYLAQQHGLTGKDAFESLQCDEIVATFADLMAEMRTLFNKTPEALAARMKVMTSGDQQVYDDHFKDMINQEAREKFVKETLPSYYERFDNIIKKNGGHTVGNSLTWADIYLTVMVDQYGVFAKTDILKDFANLKALRDKVVSLPGISDWIKKRPVTVF